MILIYAYVVMTILINFHKIKYQMGTIKIYIGLLVIALCLLVFVSAGPKPKKSSPKKPSKVSAVLFIIYISRSR